MTQCEYITDSYNGRGERVVLWRIGEYTYELEIGAGVYKKNLMFYETEYYEALEFFNSAVANYRNMEEV